MFVMEDPKTNFIFVGIVNIYINIHVILEGACRRVFLLFTMNVILVPIIVSNIRNTIFAFI